MTRKLSRRAFVRYAGVAAGGAALSTIAGACAAPTAQAPAAQPQTASTAASTQAAPAAPAADQPQAPAGASGEAGKIVFWSHPYGDAAQWQELLKSLAADFKQESGVDVQVELLNWSIANQTWLTVVQGGAAPDCADMFWLHSHAAIGGGKHGPMPLDDYQATIRPDLKEAFYEPALNDVFWQGKFYGVPWRGDIRPMLYRIDQFQEAGLDRAPDTWDEITEYAKALTVRSGNDVTRWGFTFGQAKPIQQMLPYYWQAGGEYMTSDGKTATIDTPEMRETLHWMYDLIWTHQVVTPEFMEKSYNPYESFTSGTLAMIGSVSDSMGADLERDFADLNEKWAMAIQPKGPKNRAAYSGAGYWGVLHGTTKVDESVQWITYLARDANMQRLAEFIARVSPNKKVMASPFWSDRPWKKVLGKTLEHAHTSQHPSPAWAKLVAPEPGGVMFDLFYDALVKKDPIDDVVVRTQKRMQEEMDKIQL